MKEKKQRPWATTIRLEELDRQAIDHIKALYGCPSDVAAIRLALRMTARQESPIARSQTGTSASRLGYLVGC